MYICLCNLSFIIPWKTLTTRYSIQSPSSGIRANRLALLFFEQILLALLLPLVQPQAIPLHQSSFTSSPEVGNVSVEREVELSPWYKKRKKPRKIFRRRKNTDEKFARITSSGCNDDEYPLDDFGVTSSRLRGIRGRRERRG